MCRCYIWIEEFDSAIRIQPREFFYIISNKTVNDNFPIKQEQVVDHVREICGGFSSSTNRGLCAKYADGVARNIEQLLPAHSPQDICIAKCPACAGRRNE
jgi:hypothetical protein